MKMYVDSNENESNDYNEKLQKAILNGMMALYFQKHWNLAAIPIITNINSYRMRDEVEITSRVRVQSKSAATDSNVTQRQMSSSMTLGSTNGNESDPGRPTVMPTTMGVGVEMQKFSEGDQSDPAPKEGAET